MKTSDEVAAEVLAISVKDTTTREKIKEAGDLLDDHYGPLVAEHVELKVNLGESEGFATQLQEKIGELNESLAEADAAKGEKDAEILKTRSVVEMQDGIVKELRERVTDLEAELKSMAEDL